MTPRSRILQDVSAIAKSHNLQLVDLLNPSKHRHIVKARNEAMFYVRETYDRTMTQIANIFNMHHSNVLHAIGSHMFHSGINHEWAKIYKRKVDVNRARMRKRTLDVNASV